MSKGRSVAVISEAPGPVAVGMQLIESGKPERIAEYTTAIVDILLPDGPGFSRASISDRYFEAVERTRGRGPVSGPRRG